MGVHGESQGGALSADQVIQCQAPALCTSWPPGCHSTIITGVERFLPQAEPWPAYFSTRGSVLSPLSSPAPSFSAGSGPWGP